MADPDRGQAPPEGEKKGMSLIQKMMVMLLILCEFLCPGSAKVTIGSVLCSPVELKPVPLVSTPLFSISCISPRDSPLRFRSGAV